MGMLFGGWAEEENEKSPEEKDHEEWYRRGIMQGWNEGLNAAQLFINQSDRIEHKDKLELYLALEKLKRER